jgi:hypothetical protein
MSIKILQGLKKETLEDGEEQQPGSDLRQNCDISAVKMKFENSPEKYKLRPQLSR